MDRFTYNTLAVPMPAVDLDIERTVKEMFDVNLFGAMRMVKEFSKLLIAAEGTIVNISSCAPLFPLVYGSAYNSTKAALQAYGDTLRVEMKPFKYAYAVHTFNKISWDMLTIPGLEASMS